MKKLILSCLIVMSMFSMISCVSLEDVAYHDEYVVGTTSYPVCYINSYPYYWFDNTWVMIPTYRYVYIRHINVPRHVRAYRPNPHHYMHRPGPNDRYSRRPGDYRRPGSHSGVPHTRQPNVTRPNNKPNGGRPNGGGQGRFGGRR